MGCPTLECSYGSCFDHVHPRRGGNAGEEVSQREPWRWTSRLARSHAMIQAQNSGGTGCVDGEARIVKAHQERE